jgi:hypothetical protein
MFDKQPVARELAPVGLCSSPKIVGGASHPSGSKLPRHRFTVFFNFAAILSKPPTQENPSGSFLPDGAIDLHQCN